MKKSLDEMSHLSDERYDCAFAAVRDSEDDLLEAQNLAEDYYRGVIAREMSFGEVQDLSALVDRLFEENQRRKKSKPNRYRDLKSK